MPNATLPRLFDAFEDDAPGSHVFERFDVEGDWIARAITRSSGSDSISRVRRLRSGSRHDDLAAAFDAAWLRAPSRPPTSPGRQVVRIADLFSGCGGLSLGAFEACRALGMQS